MEQVTSGSIVRLIPDTYSYKWVISNAHALQHQKKLRSPSFVTGANKENTWCLKFYNTCELSICLQDSKEDTVNAIIQVHSPIEEKTTGNYYAHGVFYYKVNFTKGLEECLHDFPELYVLYDKHGWAKLPHDYLTIICEIKHCPKGSSVFADRILRRDLRLMFKNGENSDVKIIVGRKEFRVHKFMLAARSPLFSKMFQRNVTENQRNTIIENTDIGYDTMGKLLEYVYTGRVTKIDEATDRLLIAADMCALEGLKCMCSNMLIKKIDTENMCEMMKLAAMCTANDLEAGVLDYLSLHFDGDSPLIPLNEILSNFK